MSAPPDWVKTAGDKIGEVLEGLPPEKTCCVLFTALLAAHAKYFNYSNRHRAALDLADRFTEIAAKFDVMQERRQ